MECTCTFTFIQDGNTQLGTRTSSLCQACVDNNANRTKLDREREIKIQLRELDIKLIRPLSEGDNTRVSQILAEKQILRDELNAL